MKPKLSLVSALLAGAMAFSLAGCAGGEPGGATPASASGAAEATAAPADAVPQGRWVESTIDTLPQNLYLGDPPARLDDGSLVAYGRDETTDPTEVVRLTSADNGATWQTEPLDWAARPAATSASARCGATAPACSLPLSAARPKSARPAPGSPRRTGR